MILSRTQTRILAEIVPAILILIFFEAYLGPRHDYAGHFLAGYGGTLGACMVWMRQRLPMRHDARGELEILIVCLACIGLGAVTEATIFRIAKFDEIDFCSQSLGAVLAGIAAMGFLTSPAPPVGEFDRRIIVGIVFLGAGGCFAVA